MWCIVILHDHSPFNPLQHVSINFYAFNPLHVIFLINFYPFNPLQHYVFISISTLSTFWKMYLSMLTLLSLYNTTFLYQPLPSQPCMACLYELLYIIKLTLMATTYVMVVTLKYTTLCIMFVTICKCVSIWNNHCHVSLGHVDTINIIMVCFDVDYIET